MAKTNKIQEQHTTGPIATEFDYQFYLLKYLIVLFNIFLIISCTPKIHENITQFHTDTANLIIKDTLPGLYIIDSLKKVNIQLPEVIRVGAERSNKYLHKLYGKKIAVVANQTSLIDTTHLVDFLLSKNINVVKILSPEHGFRGTVDRGKSFKYEFDIKTGIPIIPIYGSNRKPKPEQLKDVDIVIFDIQDVGVRFYTYISSMHYVMEACAENNKKLIIFDRPNPLCDYIDGPVLNIKYRSFVGMHPIPVVHGLTVGELALMINGEGWLKGGIKCDLEVVKVENYDHSMLWHLDVKPSPNLPNDIAIRLYPSLCFFEATKVSIGRGTEFPFQVIGYPDKQFGNFIFIPRDISGMQMNPIQEGKTCFGIDLQNSNSDAYFSLQYIIEFADKFENRADMITNRNWFNLLAGNSLLADQIIKGMTEDEIRETWKEDLEAYKKMRKKYLLYVDFE